jgi:hypothetical protein
MAIEINLNNSDEFQDMIDKKDFTISKAVVETILANLNTRKKYLHVLSVNCLEDGATYDITLEKKYFAETLQENLKYYVEKELYEECSQIVEAINQLKEKTDGNKNPDTSSGKGKKKETK